MFSFSQIDCQLLEMKDEYSSSKIIEMFTKQNKRVLQVFSTSEDDAEDFVSQQQILQTLQILL